VTLAEPEAQERQCQADAVRGAGELLGEEDQPDRPEQIQRPADRACDEDCGEEALG
jgi:hypothetical protein